MRKFNQLLKAIDCYAEPISLRFRKEQKTSSVCGGIIGLLTILLGFYLSMIDIMEAMSHSSQHISVYEVPNDQVG